MDLRFGLVFLLVLNAGWACAARQLAVEELPTRSTVISDIPDSVLVKTFIEEKRSQTTDTLYILQIYKETDSQASDEVIRNNQVCTLCEEFVTQALDNLADNKTQTEIIEILHASCSRVPTFKQECITLVDYYAPLFFTELSMVQPELFCRKINLCQEMATVSSQLQQNSCGMCHHAVLEVLIKLKDPDTQLEIIEVLLKACNSMENHAQKCKQLVFEYGPLILANAEQFLETTDICTMLHACDSPKPVAKEASIVLKADS